MIQGREDSFWFMVLGDFGPLWKGSPGRSALRGDVGMWGCRKEAVVITMDQDAKRKAGMKEGPGGNVQRLTLSSLFLTARPQPPKGSAASPQTLLSVGRNAHSKHEVVRDISDSNHVLAIELVL